MGVRKPGTKLHRSINGHFVLWRYGILHIIAAEGSLTSQLKRVQKRYEGEAMSFRLMHDNGEELYLFRRTTPFIYCRITQIKKDKDTLVAVQSTDKRTAKDFIDDVVRRSGFSPYSPGNNVIDTIEWSLKNVEIPSYDLGERTFALIGRDPISGWRDFPTALTEMYYNGTILGLSELPKARGVRLK